MFRSQLVIIVLSLVLLGCSISQKAAEKYPRMPNNDSERKSGPAMLLYEQAEKDADINENVILTPPKKKEKNLE